MEPRKESREWQVLSLLRKDRPAAVDVRSLVELPLLEGGVKELQKVIANLRRMGFGILSWSDRRDRRVYAYQLKQEARAEDPFDYLKDLLGRLRERVIRAGGYRITIGWQPAVGRDPKTVIFVYLHEWGERNFAKWVERYTIDRSGVVSFGWDESKLGAQPLIPVTVLRLSGLPPSPEEKMLVDHIRAHIVQNFVRQALTEEDKKRSSSAAKVS